MKEIPKKKILAALPPKEYQLCNGPAFNSYTSSLCHYMEYVLAVSLGLVIISSFKSNKPSANTTITNMELCNQFWIGAWVTAGVYVGLTVPKIGIQIVSIFSLFLISCLSLIRLQWPKSSKVRDRIHILMHLLATSSTVLLISTSSRKSYSLG